MSENPSNPYEEMLERRDMACCMYACWKPVNAFVMAGPNNGCGRGADYEAGMCAEHALDHGSVNRWLET